MKILYFCSTWGLDHLPTLAARFEKIKRGGFDGVEVDIPLELAACRSARSCLADLGLEVVAQQWRSRGRTPAEHMNSFADQYARALELRPLFVNSHTGCDHFALEDNLAIFDHATRLAAAGGVQVFHETHRGRALFSVPAAMALLAARPDLRLTADFSHWCCVHESLLEDQAAQLERATRHCHAIHARVGHAEGPQITDPRDSLWEPTMQAHVGWWKRIISHRRAEGCAVLTVCPEFGPPPYMTLLPHSGRPVADLWDINCYMRDWLKERLAASAGI